MHRHSRLVAGAVSLCAATLRPPVTRITIARSEPATIAPAWWRAGVSRQPVEDAPEIDEARVQLPCAVTIAATENRSSAYRRIASARKRCSSKVSIARSTPPAMDSGVASSTTTPNPPNWSRTPPMSVATAHRPLSIASVNALGRASLRLGSTTMSAARYRALNVFAASNR